MTHPATKNKQRTPFLKLYTDDWIAGTIDLSFEEKGFYFELLLRMWERKASLPNDERWIACALGCNPRTVRKLLSALVDSGKLYIENGQVVNARMMREISTHLEDVARKSKPNSEPIGAEFAANSTGTTAKTAAKSTTDDSLPYSRSQKVEKKVTPPVVPPQPEAMPPAAPPARTAKRGSRLPDDWTLPDDWRQWALTNCPASSTADVDREALKFANFWQAKAGANACKLDWSKTWRNWCLTAFARAPVKPAAAQAVDFRAARREAERQMLAELGAFS